MNDMTLWRNAHLATCSGRSGWGWIPRGAIVTAGDRLHWVGAENDLPADLHQQVCAVHDLQGALVTPGLIDCHTHLIYGGTRAQEFDLRLQGASYEEIARAGGGIRSTVEATRAASDGELFMRAQRRARALMKEGVTTIEIKSGYGLDLHHERRMLSLARQLGKSLPLNVQSTYLGAHALPAEYATADDYIDDVCLWLQQLHAEKLVDAVDAFCENIGFSIAQTRRVFTAARSLGLPVKLHAEQLSNQGGAVLASEFGALSCDHLEYLDEQGVKAMAASQTVAVLLPGAFYFLRETTLPPIALLRTHAVPIALASDHNPGSSPGLSLLLMMSMACTFFRLSPEEALRGVTTHAAQALGLHDRGALIAGYRADFVVWDLEHPRELAYWFGHNPCLQIVCGGVSV